MCKLYPWINNNKAGFYYLNVSEWNEYKNKKNINFPKRHLHHLRNVLRVKDEVKIWVTNGLENVILANLTEDNIIHEPEETYKINKKKPSFYIAMPMLKKKYMEFLIQKSIELGVNGFYFIDSDRSVIKEMNKEKLNLMAENALYQSKNPIMPFFSFEIKNIYQLNSDNRYVFWSDVSSNNSLTEISNKNFESFHEIIFINGPEGGWSKDEKEYLKNNFQNITLSHNVLRSETAAICVTYHINLILDRLNNESKWQQCTFK
ncbi:MAG: 16S rRNA (uracil(1498)-N(3))-methyltransferase [Spirochaetia bacterium]|nr:16S rRNA (uracil(1498)-N(3))-methyltransferase [Spirochaetia bacterium]